MLTVRERAEIVKDGYTIALPLAEHCNTWLKISQWKNLSDDDFMTRYGNNVLAQYSMPTEAEMSRLEEWDADEEDEDEDEDDIDENEVDADEDE